MLSWIVFIPVAVGLIGFLLPSRIVGWWALLGSLGSLGLAIALVIGFDSAGGTLQDVVDHSWIPQLGVRFQLGVDGLSLFLVLLTSLLWSATILWSALQYPDRPRNYFFMLGLAQTATLGAFLAQDLLLFVLFFDLMLIPFYFLIGSWGTGERIKATIKMIIYTAIGSLLMLVGAIATAVLSADTTGGVTFSIEVLRQFPLPTGSQYWIFAFFSLAFLIKMPAVLVHGWVVDAYRACPLPVLVLLGGVLSKVAAYGFLRIVMPVFPDAAIHFQDVLLIIGVASILYGSAMAFMQTNVRLIVGVLLDRPDGLHHDRHLQPRRRRRRRLGHPDGQPRPRGRPGLPDHRPARRAHRHRGHPRDGRHGEAGPGAGGPVRDRDDGATRDPRLGQLRRRVLHPQGRLRDQGRDRPDRVDRHRPRRVLLGADVPADDAQPAAGWAPCRARSRCARRSSSCRSSSASSASPSTPA